MPSINLFSDLFPKIEITNAIFDDIEEKCGLSLPSDRREYLRSAIRTYDLYRAREQAFRGSKGDRNRIEKSIVQLDKLLDELSGLAKSNPTLAKWIFYPRDAADEIEYLTAFRDGIVAHLREKNRKGPVPAFIPLGRLLLSLESYFIAGGGTRTSVSRDPSDGTRYSPFVSFAWDIIGRFPEGLRPASGQALMTVWEEVDEARQDAERAKKGIRLERRLRPPNTRKRP
jgi:hypothetical protein